MRGQDGAVRGALAGWQTLSGAADPRANRLDRLIVYATADSDDGFTPAELQRRLRDREVPCAVDAVNQALDRLDLAFILTRGTDGRYRYPVPLFLDLMRETDLDLALADEREDAARDGF